MKRNNGFSENDHTWIICAYRESPYLEECIISLKHQSMASRIQMVTSTPNEHIFRLAEKNGISLKINTGESGIGGDWNFALKNGDTELITLAHQDDRYEPEYTSSMLSVMNRSKDPIVFFSDYYELKNGERTVSDRLLKIKRWMLFPTRLFPERRWARRLSISFGNPVCCPSVTYRKSIMAGRKFGTRFKSDLDWEMIENLSRLDGSFVYYSKPLMGHRIHEESATSELIASNTRSEEDLEMYCRFWPGWIAKRLSRLYADAEKSNYIDSAF